LRDKLQKKDSIINSSIYEFFCFKRSLQKDDVEQILFVENLKLFIVEILVAFVISKKCVVKGFGASIVSLHSIPFSKNNSYNVLLDLVGKN